MSLSSREAEMSNGVVEGPFRALPGVAETIVVQLPREHYSAAGFAVEQRHIRDQTLHLRLQDCPELVPGR